MCAGGCYHEARVRYGDRFKPNLHYCDWIRRWTALGYLHDALKCADPKGLKKVVSGEFKKLPPAVLHGPAAAALLAKDGVEDSGLLLGVAGNNN